MPAHLLQIAKKLAHDAGRLAQEYQAKGFKIENKSATDIVTEADKACEALILKTIQENFPDHAILTEESGMIGDPKAEYKWIVDPIDGTTNFSRGLPFYAVSIAVVHRGLPIIGVVEAPALNEVFWARKGEGAYLGRKQIHVSRNNKFEGSLVAYSLPYDRTSPVTGVMRDIMLEAHMQARDSRHFGAAALETCYIADGRIDATLHYQVKPWDIAASKIILEEAGGMMTDVDGNTLIPKNGRALSSNGLLHQAMVDLVKKHKGDEIS